MTVQIPILNHTLSYDAGVYPSKLGSQMALTNAKTQMCTVMPFPTGSDVGVELAFTIPQNYSSAPVLVIRGILDGTPANALAFGAQQVSTASSETADVAYETEDLANNSTWTGYTDEEMYEETITLTPASAYVAGDVVFLKFYRDDSVDTTTFDFLLLDLLFQYTEA